jgi:hypothetical protein
MLGRFQLKRGVAYPKAKGAQFKDTRKHTSHVLAPPTPLVKAYFQSPTLEAWQKFQTGYLQALRERFRKTPERFEELRELATSGDYYLGCNCPTTKNPFPCRCHTIVAIEFLKELYPDLEVDFNQYPYLGND